MEFFRKYFDSTVEVLASIAQDTDDVSDLQLMIFTGYASSLDDDYIITKFIEKCFPHLDALKTKETPEPLLDLLKAKNFSDLYDSLDDDTKEDLWELIHGMVKSAILHIHRIKEHDGERYTKRYYCEYKIGRLSKEWDVDLI